MDITKGWSDCSIDLFYAIDDVLKDEKLTVMQKNVKLISLIFDIPEDTVYQMDINEYNRYISQLQWINNNSLNEKFKTKSISIYDNVYIVTPINKLTIAQYIDFQTFWQKNDIRTYMGNILASFIVPKGHKYGEGYDVLELANHLRNNLSILEAHNLLFFFLKKYLISIRDSFIYLRKKLKTKEEKQKIMEALQMILDGFRL